MKILIFEPWSLGYNYVKELFEEKSEHEYIYVHCDSLQTGNVKRDILLYANDIPLKINVFDFENYEYSFLKLFKSEKPDILLVLSIHSIEQRAATFIAKIFGIKSCLIMHGAFSSNSNSYLLPFSYYLKNFREKFTRVIYFAKFYKIFVYNLFQINGFSEVFNILSHFCSFSSLIIFHERWKWLPNKYSKNFITLDRAILADSSAKELFKDGMGLEKTVYEVAGLIDYYRLKQEVKKFNPINWSNSKILFISSPALPNDEEVFIKLLISFSDNLLKNGYNLVFRPHVADSLNVINQLNSHGIEISHDRSFNDLLTCKAAAGINSSLLLSVAKLGKNIVFFEFVSMPIANSEFSKIKNKISVSNVYEFTDFERILDFFSKSSHDFSSLQNSSDPITNFRNYLNS